MSFEKIISIPGMGGLFKMVAQMRNGGYVVEALADKRRVPVSAMQRIIMLKDISVYTTEGDVPLYDVFKKMKDMDSMASGIGAKAEADELRAGLKKILPDFDDERVHTSDIRKMFSWYGMLKEEIGSEESEAAMKAEANADEPLEAVNETVEETPAEEAPKKKVVKKKKADEPVAESVDAEETPKKKAPRKTTKKAE
ncbi:hypothetical protein BH11BAC2_BH11BAC2_22640 [soil metagenome]